MKNFLLISILMLSSFLAKSQAVISDSLLLATFMQDSIPNKNFTHDINYQLRRIGKSLLSNGQYQTFTPGSLLFAGGTGKPAQNNSQIFWNNSTKKLSIGNTYSDAKVSFMLSDTTRYFPTGAGDAFSVVNWNSDALEIFNENNTTTDGYVALRLTHRSSSSSIGRIMMQGSQFTGDSYLRFQIRESGLAFREVLSICENGKTGIGVPLPSASLHIRAGTATAGTSPLKLTTGTNLTTPEQGAVEWDGANLFITQATGPTRKTLAYTTDILDNSPTNEGNLSIGHLTDNTAKIASNTSGDLGVVLKTRGGKMIEGSGDTIFLNVASGVFPPTLTLTDVTVVDTGAFHFMRVGDVVTVTGFLEIDPALVVACQIDIAPPVIAGKTPATGNFVVNMSPIAAPGSVPFSEGSLTGGNIRLVLWTAADATNRRVSFSGTIAYN